MRPRRDQASLRKVFYNFVVCVCVCGATAEEVHNVVFIKTHSTGSSTLTSIFHRFCDSRRGVSCFVYPKNTHPGHTVSPQQLQKYAGDMKKEGRSINIWPNHVVFAPDVFDQMIPGNVKISIFREPLSRIESSFRHRKASSRLVVSNLKRLKNDHHVKGCGPEGILSSYHVPLRHFEKLDMVLLTEQYHLSLMMLRHRLGWRMTDMIYKSMKNHSSLGENFPRAWADFKAYVTQPKNRLTQAARSFVDRCLQGEELEIYQRAAQKFEVQIQNFGPKQLRADVAVFEQLLSVVTSCCSSKRKASEFDSYCQSLRQDNVPWNHAHQEGKVYARDGSACWLAAERFEHDHA